MLPGKKIDEPFNDSFNAPENKKWWKKTMFYTPGDLSKPIVFVPCARTKPFSKSMTHCFMSKITRDQRLEIITLSEPLVIVPYSMENLIPLYNYPPKLLKKRPDDKIRFINRLRIFLRHLKLLKINTVYYVGGNHHYEILTKANYLVELEIIAVIPKRGIRDYKIGAQELSELIPA